MDLRLSVVTRKLGVVRIEPRSHQRMLAQSPCDSR